MRLITQFLANLVGSFDTDPPRKNVAINPCCPVCKKQTSHFLDALDFNRSCEDRRARLLPRSKRKVSYFLCADCGFCFAPEFLSWTQEEFGRFIYNAEYIKVDPDCNGSRQNDQIRVLESLMGEGKQEIEHIDYGSGLGLLSKQMNEAGWRSCAYDPYLDSQAKPEKRFDLVTVFEVFEHAPDPHALMADVQSLLKPDGLLFFSTLLSDGSIRPTPPLNWWYAAPRNGHISLYSAHSLRQLMAQHGFTLVSLSDLFHYAYSGKPPA